MPTNDSTHPLGNLEADEIDPDVAAALTPYQVEWLHRQCTDLGMQKLQILRQALFEWIDEHLDYRFSAATFGSAMRHALENYINRHNEEFVFVPRLEQPLKALITRNPLTSETTTCMILGAFVKRAYINLFRASEDSKIARRSQSLMSGYFESSLRPLRDHKSTCPELIVASAP